MKSNCFGGEESEYVNTVGQNVQFFQCPVNEERFPLNQLTCNHYAQLFSLITPRLFSYYYIISKENNQTNFLYNLKNH